MSIPKIQKSAISQNALAVIRQLKKAGFQAYLVGGCVRDLLLGLHPKDFDVVTNAQPFEIKRLFKRVILVGRRFLLAHVYFGQEHIEVATFRAPHDQGAVNHQGVIFSDNVYGSLEEDRVRRDLTINAMYYDPEKEKLIDQIGGVADLQKKMIKMIGDPIERFREDPVRMLRAIRFAAKLKFNIDKKSAVAIPQLTHLLAQVAPARLYEEVLKLLKVGETMQCLFLLKEYKLLPCLFEQPAYYLEDKKYAPLLTHFLQLTFEDTDLRAKQHKSISPSFLFSVLLWFPFKIEMETLMKKNNFPIEIAIQTAAAKVLKKQHKQTNMPRYLIESIEDIWDLQFQLEVTDDEQYQDLITHPKLRAAVDMLLLRAKNKEIDIAIANWWLKRIN